MLSLIRPSWVCLLLFTTSLLAVNRAHADWVLDLGASFDVRVVGKDDFSEMRTTYEMVITNYTNTTYDCTGSIGYYRIDTGSTVQGNSGQGAAPPGGPWKIVASSVAFSEKLSTGYEYLKATCTPRSDAEDGDGPGGGGGIIGGGTGGTQYVRFGEGMLGYTLDQNNKSAELRIAKIENHSGTRTSATVTVELWALNAPYTGTATSGVLLASSRLPPQCTDANGRLSPGMECSNIVINTALTVPSPGMYTAVYVLKESMSGCTGVGCPVDYFNFKTNGLTFATTNTSPQGLSFTGLATYSLNIGNNSGAFTASKLVNNSTSTTNQLQLELWLTSQPYTGASFTGYKVLSTGLPGTCPAQLSPGQSCNNMSYSSSLLTKVPDGNYYVTLFATRQTPSCTSNGGYCVSTSVDMGLVSISNPVAAPPAPSSDDDGDGGGGSMGHGLLLSLGLLWMRRIHVHRIRKMG